MDWSEDGADTMCRLRCYVKDYGEKKLDLLKYRRNCFFKYKLPKGIFIIQETEGALIAPKKYDTINYQDYVLY